MNRKIVEGLATAFIIFHLLAVIVFPNPYSILARYVEPIINPYGNTFGLNTTWQFFSPDPGQMRHVEYDVIEEKNEDINFESYQWPPKEQMSFQANQARLFYHAVRTIASNYNTERFLVSYLCRRHPEATSIAIKAIEKRVPTIERARLAGEKFNEMNVVSDRLQAQEFGCDREDLL